VILFFCSAQDVACGLRVAACTPTRYRNFNGRAQLLQRSETSKMGKCRGQRAKFRTAAEVML
jgi:hypothetical protein